MNFISYRRICKHLAVTYVLHIIDYIMLLQSLVCSCMLACARLALAAISAEVVCRCPNLRRVAAVQYVFGMDGGEARLLVSLVTS